MCAVALAGCDEARRDPPQTGPTPEGHDRVQVWIADEAAAAAGRAGLDLEVRVHDALARVDQRIELPVTTIDVMDRPEDVPPETGVGGYADPGTGDVLIYVDAGRADFEDSIRTWLPATLAHELHHAARIVDGPGYGDSLTEAIVTEGLADVFSLEVFPETPTSPWVRALPRRAVCRWWTRARSIPGRSYDHGEWFFGHGEIPRRAGYSIGFAVVRDHLRRHPEHTAADLVRVPARRIVRGVRLCP